MLLGSYPSSASDLAVIGNVVYLADASKGLEIVGVSSPSAPSPLATLPIPLRAIAAIDQRYLIVSTLRWTDPNPDFRGVHIIDTSNPASPASVAFSDIDTPGSISVAANRAYVATDNGWVLLDVSNPIAPAMLGRPGLGEGAVRRVIATEKYTYVLSRVNRKFTVVDSQGPTPTTVGAFTDLNDPQDFAISGVTAYIADDVGGVKALDLPTEFPQLQWTGRQIKLTGPIGMNGRILRSADLLTWDLLTSVTIAVGGTDVSDSLQSGQAFYLFVSP